MCIEKEEKSDDFHNWAWENRIDLGIASMTDYHKAIDGAWAAWKHQQKRIDALKAEVRQLKDKQKGD